MRRVVVYQLTSLDGVAEEPGDWMTDGGPEVFAEVADVIGTQTDVLLGRRTYEYWCDFWPHDGPDPFRSFINGTTKHVFTSTAFEPAWENTVVVTGSAVDHVRTLREGEGGDVGVHGSVALAASLLQAGLVDELRLLVSASVAGHGRRLLESSDATAPPHPLELLDVDRTPAGTLRLRYRVLPQSQT